MNSIDAFGIKLRQDGLNDNHKIKKDPEEIEVLTIEVHNKQKKGC